MDSSMTDRLLIRFSVFADISAKIVAIYKIQRNVLVSIYREVLYNIIDQFGVHKHFQLSPFFIKHHIMTGQPPEKQPQISSE